MYLKNHSMFNLCLFIFFNVLKATPFANKLYQYVNASIGTWTLCSTEFKVERRYFSVIFSNMNKSTLSKLYYQFNQIFLILNSIMKFGMKLLYICSDYNSLKNMILKIFLYLYLCVDTDLLCFMFSSIKQNSILYVFIIPKGIKITVYTLISCNYYTSTNVKLILAIRFEGVGFPSFICHSLIRIHSW